MNQDYATKMVVAPTLAVLALALSAPLLSAQAAFQQTNLVSDVPGLAARLDPNLVNPWGISASATSPFWVSNAGTGTSSLYNTAGVPQALVVTIPSPGGGPSVPTGQVFNNTGAFNNDTFLFASARGTIAGWRNALGTTAEILVNNSASGASYLGLALGTTGGSNYLYAANFAQGRIDVFSGPSTPATLAGAFADSTLPFGYAPFNIQNIGGSLFVTYALRGPDGRSLDGLGNGFVDRFDLNGNLLGRFASAGVLDSPWGLARAPAGFGTFGGSLLIGNFGDGTINAFDFTSGAFLGTLKDELGNPLVNDGLWGLQFGNGGNGGALNTLYLAAGINNEQNGLFASITAVPEPSIYGIAAVTGLAGLVAFHRKRRTSCRTSRSA